MKQLQKNCRTTFPEGSASRYARYTSRISSIADQNQRSFLNIRGPIRDVSIADPWVADQLLRVTQPNPRTETRPVTRGSTSLTFFCSFLSKFSGIKGYSREKGKVDQFNHVNKGSITFLSFSSFYSFLHIEDNMHFKCGGGIVM